MGRDVAGPVRAVVVGGDELGALFAICGGPVKFLVAHVGRSGAGLAEERSRVFKRVNDVDVARVAAECRIGPAVLFGEV